MRTRNIMTKNQVENKFFEGLRPLKASKALLFFLIPALLLRLSTYHIYPWLLKQGIAENAFEAFILTWLIPVVLMFAAAFAVARIEGVPESGRAFANRFRLKRLTRRDGLLIGFGVMAALSSFILVPVRDWMMSLSPVFNPPDFFPVLLNPQLQGADLAAVTKDWLGPEVIGNLGYAFLAILLYAFNTFGEELYFRGIILPRQELVYGGWTWVVHGLMWVLFHVPVYPWYLIYSLPLAFGFAYIAQKSQNTWVPIILHTILNFYMYGMLVSLIMG